MITPEFLQGSSDEQINMGVAWLEAVKLSKMLPAYSLNRGDISEGACIGLLNVNYCTSPNDAWPIMMENKIGVWNAEHQGRNWMAKGGYISEVGTYEYHVSEGINPLRAAMEVYILMMVAK